MRPLSVAESRVKSSLLSTLIVLVCTFFALLIPPQVGAIGPDTFAQGDNDYLHLPGIGGDRHFQWRDDPANYESEFLGLDRSIIGRAGNDETALANNAPGQLNIEQGQSQFWTFSNQSLFGPLSPPTPGLPSVLAGQYPLIKPDSPDQRVLYISFTTCVQPTPKTSNSNGPPGPLELYVSTSSDNQQPSKDKYDKAVTIDEGFGWVNISVKDDVFFGVFAPANDDFTGVYNYQLTASIDGFYASYYNERFVSFIDSDTNSALLYTNDTTSLNSSTETYKGWMSGPPAFRVFVQNVDNPSIAGMQNSICALENFADIRDPSMVDVGMTLSGDNQPKQQFHVKGLNATSKYYAIAAIKGNSTDYGNGVVGGGGTVWNSMNSTNFVNFKTKSGTSPPSFEETHADHFTSR